MTQNRKKILVLTNAFPKADSPNSGHDILEQVIRLGISFDVRVLIAQPTSLPRYRSKRAHLYSNSFDGIDIYTGQYPTIPKLGVLFSGVSYLRAVKDNIMLIRETFRFDAIISFWAYPEGFAAIRLGLKFQVPVLIRPRGSDINVFVENRILKIFLKNTLRQADRVVPVSRMLMDRIKTLGIPEQRLSFLGGGIDKDKFFHMDKGLCREQLGISHDQKIVLFVGNLLEIKGLRYLIASMKELDREKVSTDFYFIGKGPYLARIRSEAAFLRSISARTVGQVPHGELRWWMNAADILCLPSLNEGYPNVVLEAMACGLPIVASRVGDIPDIVNSNRVGILVPPGNVHKLTHALKAALSLEWKREKIEKRVEGMTWDDIGHRLVKECLLLFKENDRSGE